MKFGDFDFMSEPIGDFEGTCSDDADMSETLKAKATHYYQEYMIEQESKRQKVDSRDHDLHMYYQLVTEMAAPWSYRIF